MCQGEVQLITFASPAINSDQRDLKKMSKREGENIIGSLNAENIPWADDDTQADGANSATALGSSGETVSSEESRRRRSLMARRGHGNAIYLKIPQAEQQPGSSNNGNSSESVFSDSIDA